MGCEAKVAVVIVNYNSSKDLERCLGSLRSISYPNSFTIVVDSDSNEGSREQLRILVEGFGAIIVFNPDNKGFAASANMGICYALKAGSDFVWLLNPDTEVEADALSHLLDAANSDSAVGAVGSKILLGSGGSSLGKNASTAPTEIWSAGAKVDYELREIFMFGAGETDEGQFDNARNCDYLPGCSLLFKCSVIEKVGFLPEDYFMYFEETDWCQRMLREGYLLRYEPRSLVYHHFDASKLQEPFCVYYYNRNRRLFWLRHAHLLGKAWIVARCLFRELPAAVRAFMSASTEDEREIFRSHCRSCVDFLLCKRSGTTEIRRRSKMS